MASASARIGRLAKAVLFENKVENITKTDT